MEKEIDYNFYYEYLFKVLRHLFLNEELDSLNKEEDYVILYHIAKSHDIVSLIYYGVKDILPPSIEIKWGNKVNQNLFKSISQLEEKKIIDQLFNENQIEHTFLKGCYLKEIYPSPDFREMSDIDILVHDYDLKKIHSLLESKLNYEHESSEGSHHQTYLKKPVHNIEVHYELVDDDLPQYQYFHDYFNRLISVDNSYEKIMNLNDYFVYFLFHAYHHFYLCGIGIRYIIDLFVLLSKHKQDLDFDYINKALEQNELKSFYDLSLNLMNNIFYKESIDDDDEFKLMIINSGTYGSAHNRVLNELKRNEQSRFSYLFHRLFPRPKKMKTMYPILKKHPILFPFYYISRPFRLFKHIDTAKGEIRESKMLNNKKKED